MKLDAHGTEGVRRSDGHHTVAHGPSKKPHIFHLLWIYQYLGFGLGISERFHVLCSFNIAVKFRFLSVKVSMVSIVITLLLSAFCL